MSSGNKLTLIHYLHLTGTYINWQSFSWIKYLLVKLSHQQMQYRAHNSSQLDPILYPRNPSNLLTYLLTYLLTPCSRVRLEKLTGSRLATKFPVFYRNRRIITASQVPTMNPINAPSIYRLFNLKVDC
jgi:hypothetical protein